MGSAEKLLIESDEKIEDIMKMVGYSDKKIFYKHFKDSFGMSPGEFRKNNKNNI